MCNKIFFSIAFSLVLFALACSDDSLGGGSSIDPNAAPAVAKVDSIEFIASEGSCNEFGALMKIFVKEDSIHLYMNKDGSAVLKEKMGTICPEQGEVSKVSLEKLDDTLLVLINYYEYPPDTVIVYNDSLGKNDTLLLDRLRRKCMCFSDYEIDVPAEFVGSKFISVIRNGKALLYPIAYVKE